MTEELEEVILRYLQGGTSQEYILYRAVRNGYSQMDVLKTLEKLVDEGKVVACYNYMEKKMTFKLPEVE